MPDRAGTDKKAISEAERRKERLAAELRANLAKRKQQARGRAAAAKGHQKPDGGETRGE